MPLFISRLGIALLAAWAASPLAKAQEPVQGPLAPTAKDVFQIRVDPGLLVDSEGRTLRSGRVLVLLCETRGRLGFSDPLEAPFLRRAQPIASKAVSNLAAEEVIELGDGVSGTYSTPRVFDQINGEFHVRAVFDRGFARSHDATGNLMSAKKTIQLRRGESQTFELTLDELIEEKPLPEIPNIKWIEFESPMLSHNSGLRVMHRAGVVLPPEYHETLAKRRYWPTIYVVPGFGGDHRGAIDYARLLSDPNARSLMPAAVWVILDPNSSLAHHGFLDSENNGPRTRALVEEFIPWLENRFRLIRSPSARIITGHSSGGWSSLWLQLQHPEVFGACFASAPDPVSFAEFGTVNLYRDLNLFRDSEGELRPSLRTWLTPQDPHVILTIADEVAMERALAPNGTSGEQWDTWNAMYSSQNPDTLLPRRAFDPVTGEINPTIIELEWLPHDITLLTERNWERYGPLFQERIRLVCGDKDSFFLERAVMRLKEVVDAKRVSTGDGYIEIVKGADHSTIVPIFRQRCFQEMREWLEKGRATSN